MGHVFYKLADTSVPGVIRGPFKSLRDTAELVAQTAGVPLKRFGTGMPMFDDSLSR